MFLKSFISFCVVLILQNGVFGFSIEQTEKLESSTIIRAKRDMFEDMKSAAMMGAGEAMSRFQEGVTLKDNRDTTLSFFGTDFGGGHGHKIGFGNSLNGDPEMFRKKRQVDYQSLSESEESNEDDISRAKRSPCGKKNQNQNPENENQAQRRKRRAAKTTYSTVSAEKRPELDVEQKPELRRKRQAIHEEDLYDFSPENDEDISVEIIVEQSQMPFVPEQRPSFTRPAMHPGHDIVMVPMERYKRFTVEFIPDEETHNKPTDKSENLEIHSEDTVQRKRRQALRGPPPPGGPHGHPPPPPPKNSDSSQSKSDGKQQNEGSNDNQNGSDNKNEGKNQNSNQEQGKNQEDGQQQGSNDRSRREAPNSPDSRIWPSESSSPYPPIEKEPPIPPNREALYPYGRPLPPNGAPIPSNGLPPQFPPPPPPPCDGNEFDGKNNGDTEYKGEENIEEITEEIYDESVELSEQSSNLNRRRKRREESQLDPSAIVESINQNSVPGGFDINELTQNFDPKQFGFSNNTTEEGRNLLERFMDGIKKMINFFKNLIPQNSNQLN